MTAIFIYEIPEAARAKLVVLNVDARLIEAAAALSARTDLVVICNNSGFVQGVVSKTDVVKRMSVCTGSVCQCPVTAVMTKDVLMCRENDVLPDVLLKMKARNLKNIILVEDNNHALSLLTARSILRTLLGSALNEEEQLVDYVSGVGYR